MEDVTPEARTQYDKGLKSGALGMMSSVVIGVASTAPAYSLAATLGLVAAVVGLYSRVQSPDLDQRGDRERQDHGEFGDQQSPLGARRDLDADGGDPWSWR